MLDSYKNTSYKEVNINFITIPSEIYYKYKRY